MSAPRTLEVSGQGGTYRAEIWDDNAVIAHELPGVTMEQAWAALPRVYASLGIQPEWVEPAQRALGVHRLRVPRRLAGERPSQWLDCGQAPMVGGAIADSYELRITLSTQLVAQEGGTRLRSHLTGQARSRGTSATPVVCVSTGRLEAHIAELLRTGSSDG